MYTINNRTKLLFGLFLSIFLITSCKQQSKTEVGNTEVNEVGTPISEKVPEIAIKKLEDSPAYSEASLTLREPANTDGVANGEINFVFDVQNYELGAQTASPNASKLANSGKGQHIHFILNNQPYSAHYEPEFSKEIPSGVHHLVAFLSRSYHESVKNDNSVVVKQLTVGENAEDTIGLNMEEPTLIYSRPKGEYSGKDTDNLLLDFFVLNTTLSSDGNTVKATINGEEFILSEWAPYVITGLPKGEVNIQLELLDKNGDLILGPFNQVKRTITLLE